MATHTRLRGFITFVSCAIILAAAFVAMQAISRKRAADLRAAAKNARVATVHTTRVTRADLFHILTYNGDIQALRTVCLQPKVSGRLLKLELEDGTPVEEGVFIKAGQQLAQIDDRDFKAQLANAKAAKMASEAALQAARATLDQKKNSYEAALAATAAAKVNFEDKEREWNRQKNLSAKNASTGQQLDKAKTDYEHAKAYLKQYEADELSAKAEIASAEAAISQAEAALSQAVAKLDEAQLNLDETRIYAPMEGVVSQKAIDPGSMVSPTTTIVTMVSLRYVKVLFTIPVNQLGNIVPGKTQATLQPAFSGMKPVQCTINKIYPSVNIATRTAQVELFLENPRGENGHLLLRPGMYATIDVLIDTKTNVLAIDSTLPIRNLDRYLVYRLDGDTATAVPVKLGIRSAGLIEVLSGLKEGDEIVIQGQHRLTNGIKVRRVKPLENGTSIDVPRMN